MAKRTVRKKTSKRKPVAHVFVANQTWADGTYHVAHGPANKPKFFNKSVTRHRTRSAATKRKNSLIKSYKKKGYKVDYIYAAD